jgi:hypothetical protein
MPKTSTLELIQAEHQTLVYIMTQRIYRSYQMLSWVFPSCVMCVLLSLSFFFHDSLLFTHHVQALKGAQLKQQSLVHWYKVL